MDIINSYLTSGFLKPQSQPTYKSNLTEFFKVIKKNPDTYFDSNQDFKKDIMKYFRYLQNKESHSIKHKLYAVKSLLEYNEIDLPAVFWKKLMRTQPSRALTTIRIPTRQQLKEILTHGGAKEKALFLTAITSGMRIGEILNITLNNINLGKYPYQIDIPPTITKTGEFRITFINGETKHAIQEWLKEKPNYLKSKRCKGAHLKGHTISKTNDDRIFPFKYETARTIWNKLIISAGYDQKDKVTNRYLYHIHTLRKYFINTASPIISRDIAETLAGHEEFLKKIYPTVGPEDLAKYYKKAIPNLNIFETELDTAEIQGQQDYLQKQINNLSKELGRLINPSKEDLDDPNPIGHFCEKTIKQNTKQFHYWDTTNHEYKPFGKPYQVDEYGFPINAEEYYALIDEYKEFMKKLKQQSNNTPTIPNPNK